MKKLSSEGGGGRRRRRSGVEGGGREGRVGETERETHTGKSRKMNSPRVK